MDIYFSRRIAKVGKSWNNFNMNMMFLTQQEDEILTVNMNIVHWRDESGFKRFLFNIDCFN